MLKIYLYFISKTKEPDTWDNQFANFLCRILSQVIGLKISLSSNFSITGCEQVNAEKVNCSDYDAILMILQEKGVLEWSDDMIAFAFRKALDNGQISQFFLIQKYARQENIQSEFLGRISQYSFYELNHRTLQYIEYKPDQSGQSEDGFWSKLSDLSYDIKYIANRQHSNSEQKLTIDIFLAEVSKDQIKNRDKIKRELILAGYNVLPHYPLPRNKDDFEQKVEELLSKSFLSVHILGELYGDSPEDSDYSYCEIQNKIFDNYYNHHKTENSTNDIQRIIWLPPVVEFYEEKQAQYLKRLRKERLSKKNTEFIQCSISDLKKLIDKKYLAATAESVVPVAEKGNLPRVLIITDTEKIDLQQVVTGLSNKQNFAFEFYKGDGADSLSALMEIFMLYKYFVVINANRPVNWLRSIVNYIIRSKGYKDAMPDTSIGIFSNPKTATNEEFMLLPAEVNKYQFDEAKFRNQLELHISKLKL